MFKTQIKNCTEINSNIGGLYPAFIFNYLKIYINNLYDNL